MSTIDDMNDMCAEDEAEAYAEHCKKDKQRREETMSKDEKEKEREFKCEKCLNTNVRIQWKPAWIERNATPMMAERKPERLECICNRCGYFWAAPVSEVKG